MVFSSIREECALIGQGALSHLHTFENFPVFMGCTDAPQDQDVFADMSWWISANSGAIQLRNLLPLEVLYPESHGAGQVGKIWRDHHSALADFLSVSRPSAVFEIGGSHGILESLYQNHEEIPWTILEPNPSPILDSKATFVKGFFDEDFRFSGDFDTVVHSHVLEHIYEPAKFMSALRRFMPEGTELIFSVPNMAEMMRRMYSNCLNFEHTIFLTEDYVEYLLANNGFKLLRKQLFQDDHSIFFQALRTDRVEALSLTENLFERHSLLFSNWLDHYRNLVSLVNEQIRNVQGPVFVFGAHIFTQYLIAFGLDTSRIQGVLDNDPGKHGRRLYGTNLRVSSPAILRGMVEPHVILSAGAYNSEIRADVIANYSSRCRFYPSFDL